MAVVRVTLLSLLVAVTLGAQISSGETKLLAEMNNFNEPAGGVLGTLVPTLTGGGGPRPGSYGKVSFVLNDAQTSMTMLAQVYNIDFTGTQTADTNDNWVAAHIHASATSTPTTTAGVVWGFFGAPFNETAPNDHVFTPFATGVGGTIQGKWDATEGNGTTLAAQLNNILTSHAYINFHTTQFGGGEIRGTLLIVPEPATLSLIVLGSVSLLALRRRR
jgi:hypothetical protein